MRLASSPSLVMPAFDRQRDGGVENGAKIELCVLIGIVITLIAVRLCGDTVALTCCKPLAGGKGGRGAHHGVKELSLSVDHGVIGITNLCWHHEHVMHKPPETQVTGLILLNPTARRIRHRL